ncbi:hypothetical protein C7451_102120 [Blastomonas natatoria]|uniref:YpeB-like protein with protease inhibitory function n=1 Tax=Blastomonas natatoria TaxID=34015 RepID=A0A2V3VPI0_9SPHN|nr:hypothetical protein [Blastomonas natatoria]PXW78449.1 hypothetical protein C7451_102120 [Blastomonas natatoria]
MAKAKSVIGAALLGAAAMASATVPAAAQWHGGGPGWNGGGWGGRGDRAVNQCVRAAELEARRFGRFAQVTDIRDIDRTRRGLRVQGRLVVEQGGRWRGGGVDRGRFTCFVDRGRVYDVRLSGLGNFR